MQYTKRRHRAVRRSGMGTGTISLLMIFTVLCFATLAMLSLSTAASNRRIQQQGTLGTAELAAAQGLAAEQAAALDAALLDLFENADDQDEYYLKAGKAAEELGWTYDAGAQTVTLLLPVSNTHELLTTLQLSPLGEAARYTMLTQVSRLVDGWTPEGDGQLWQGI